MLMDEDCTTKFQGDVGGTQKKMYQEQSCQLSEVVKLSKFGVKLSD
jgi:hypothetical protein